MNTATAPDSVQVRQLRWADEARICARMMSSSEPWLTLQRSFEQCLDVLEDPSREARLTHSWMTIPGR